MEWLEEILLPVAVAGAVDVILLGAALYWRSGFNERNMRHCLPALPLRGLLLSSNKVWEVSTCMRPHGGVFLKMAGIRCRFP